MIKIAAVTNTFFACKRLTLMAPDTVLRNLRPHSWLTSSSPARRSKRQCVRHIILPFHLHQLTTPSVNTFGLWQYNYTGEYVKPQMHQVHQAYAMAPPRLKTLLSVFSFQLRQHVPTDTKADWVLDSGSIVAVQNLEETKTYDELLRRHLEKTITIKQKVQPLI